MFCFEVKNCCTKLIITIFCMTRFLLTLVSVSFFLCAAPQNIKRPKLVVGIVVDQMRWDYLYRFYNRYDENGGFKRLLNQGFSCENTFIPYIPTITACGHASIYTGSVPAINGITGNEWWDYSENKYSYSAGDSNVKTIGSIEAGEKFFAKIEEGDGKIYVQSDLSGLK